MIKVTTVTLSDCAHCLAIGPMLENLKKEYPDIEIENVQATSERGQELVIKYGIMANPGIIINDQLFAMGGTTEKDLREKFDELIGK